MKQKAELNNLIPDARWYLKESKKVFDQIVEEAKSLKGVGEPIEFKNGIVQYSVRGNTFLPIGETVRTLPAGWFNLVYSGEIGYLPQLITVKNEELIRLPIPEYDQVLLDIKKFWESESDYRKYKFAYKRGIILYGQPGTGKSGLLKLLADDLIKNAQGVVFNVGSPDEIFAFEKVFAQFREVEPLRNAICVLEDIDNFVRYGGSSVSKLLNILDGNMKYDNIVFLATTNFPEVLLSSLANRPSRFDRRYEIGAPDTNAREVYIRTKFKELPEEEVKRLVSVTENFTIDQLKELIVTIYVLKYDFDESVKKIRELFTYKRGNYDVSTDSELKEGLEQLEITDREEFNFETENT